MKTNQLLAALLVLVLALLTSFTPAYASGQRHKINAKGTGQLTSPTTTAGQIIGGGLLHGTTTAELNITAVDDLTGDAAYVGTFVITTKHGTLTFNDVGVFNLRTGAFNSHSTVVAGTGRFAGATGDLYFAGVVDLPTGSFTDEISGAIFLDR